MATFLITINWADIFLLTITVILTIQGNTEMLTIGTALFHLFILLNPRTIFAIVVSFAFESLGGGFDRSPGAAGIESDFVEVNLFHCGVPYFNFVVHIII
jgi:hypothetical protein